MMNQLLSCKNAVIAIVIIAFLLSMTACAESRKSGSDNVPTKVIEDCLGRTVEIPAAPKRIACLYAGTAHMMALLDVEDRIVGAPNGVKSDVLMQIKYPGITDVATPYGEGAVNAEELLRIDADLALIRSDLAQSEGETEKLDKLGIPYAVVDYYSVEDLYRAVRVIGEIFEEQKKAESYLQFMDDSFEIVKERIGDPAGGAIGTGNASDAVPVVYHAVNEAIRTDGDGDICAQIMERAGVRDASNGKGLTQSGNSAYATLEEIYKWDPDAIIANESSVTDYILSDSKWSGMGAVKAGEVYTLPVGVSRWCHPGSMEPHMGALFIAKTFYREAFADFDLTAYTRNYYQTYFGLAIDDEMMRNVMTGAGMRKSNEAERKG